MALLGNCPRGKLFDLPFTRGTLSGEFCDGSRLDMTPEICPICGAEVPPNAPACPECGADEQTGWSERARAQELGLPDDEFDYDEFVKEEFGPKEKLRPRGFNWFWWVIALILLALFVVWMLRI